MKKFVLLVLLVDNLFQLALVWAAAPVKTPGGWEYGVGR
jgi:hypothetical protein